MTTETFDVLFTNEKDKIATGNNPPVFPNKEVNDYGIIIKRQEGISLRDYFAGMAISNIEIAHINQGFETEIANRAYLLADAMLKQREL